MNRMTRLLLLDFPCRLTHASDHVCASTHALYFHCPSKCSSKCLSKCPSMCVSLLYARQRDLLTITTVTTEEYFLWLLFKKRTAAHAVVRELNCRSRGLGIENFGFRSPRDVFRRNIFYHCSFYDLARSIARLAISKCQKCSRTKYTLLVPHNRGKV